MTQGSQKKIPLPHFKHRKDAGAVLQAVHACPIGMHSDSMTTSRSNDLMLTQFLAEFCFRLSCELACGFSSSSLQHYRSHFR